MGDDTLDKQFKKIDERFDNVDEKFVKIDQRFDNVETSQTKMAIAIVNLQEEMKEVKKTMATKGDMRDIKDTLDALLKINKTNYEEGVMMSYRIQEHDKDIQKLKVVTGLA